MMRLVRRKDNNSERKRQSKWGKINYQGDRESVVRDDSAVVSW